MKPFNPKRVAAGFQRVPIHMLLHNYMAATNNAKYGPTSWRMRAEQVLPFYEHEFRRRGMKVPELEKKPKNHPRPEMAGGFHYIDETLLDRALKVKNVMAGVEVRS